MDETRLIDIEVRRTYDVSGLDQVRDCVGCTLDPHEATVGFSTRHHELRPIGVRVKGRRTSGLKTTGHYNDAHFNVRPDGTVEPHYRWGPPPAWVTKVVRLAIEQQSGISAGTVA